MVMDAPQSAGAGRTIFDTGATDQLRRGLQNPTDASIEQVAKEFESLFVTILLDGMRDTTPGDDIFGGDQMEQYEQLHDQQLALSISEGRGLGIAAMVERQLREQAGMEVDPRGAIDRGIQDYDRSQPAMVRPGDGPDDAGVVGEARPDRAASAPAADPANWDSPEAFVRDVWPAAQDAAADLGVDPRALVAQAALETGWGQHVIQRGDGGSSHNLFGIKAHNGWDGDVVRVPTLEFRDGIPQRELADFRAYDSVAASFHDFADFVRDNPRYQQALEQRADPDAWIEALHGAGYATDPHYAEKVRSIMRGEHMETSLNGLKDSAPAPTLRTAAHER